MSWPGGREFTYGSIADRRYAPSVPGAPSCARTRDLEGEQGGTKVGRLGGTRSGAAQSRPGDGKLAATRARVGVSLDGARAWLGGAYGVIISRP